MPSSTTDHHLPHRHLRITSPQPLHSHSLFPTLTLPQPYLSSVIFVRYRSHASRQPSSRVTQSDRPTNKQAQIPHRASPRPGPTRLIIFARSQFHLIEHSHIHRSPSHSTWIDTTETCKFRDTVGSIRIPTGEPPPETRVTNPRGSSIKTCEVHPRAYLGPRSPGKTRCDGRTS